MIKPPSFKTDWDFYFKYLGLGLIAVSLILIKIPNSKIILAIGLIFLAIALMKKK